METIREYMDSIYSQQFMEGNIEAPEDIAQEQADMLVKSMIKGAEPFLKTLKLGATASVGPHWIH